MPISKDQEKRKRQLANLENGKKFTANDERARNAGRKSALVRAEFHKSADRLKRWKGTTATHGGKTRESVFYPGEEMQNGEFLDLKLISMARDGNLDAIKYIDKKTGDAPNEQVDVNLGGSVNVEHRYVFHDIDEEDL